MSTKPKQDTSSGLFVRWPAILAFLVLGLVAMFFSAHTIAMMLFFLFILTLLSRLWAALSVRRVSVHLQVDRQRLFPGDQACLTYTVQNDKLLPLIWLELFQPLPASLCLTPVDADEHRQLSEHEKFDFEDTEYSQSEIAEKRFSLLLWHQTLQWNSIWQANCRGIYTMNHSRIRTGDGFGLTTLSWPLDKQEVPTFAVYPALLPVNIELFLRDLWDVQSGAKGFIDDVTVLRTTREYRHGDPVKHMNWKMVARQQPLSINLYETIQPRTAHFILDSESFNGMRPQTEALEETLSILGSLLLRLRDAGVPTGLSMPKTGRYEALNMYASDKVACEDMLYQLAAFQFCPLIYPLSQYEKDKNPTWGDSEDGSGQPAYGVTFRATEQRLIQIDPEFVKPEDQLVPYALPSAFADEELLASAETVGHFYYLVHDLAALKGRMLLKQLDPADVTILCYQQAEEMDEELMDFSIVLLSQLKGGKKNATP